MDHLSAFWRMPVVLTLHRRQPVRAELHRQMVPQTFQPHDHTVLELPDPQS